MSEALFNIGYLINILAPFGERQTMNKMFAHSPGQLLLQLFDPFSEQSTQRGVTAVFLQHSLCSLSRDVYVYETDN